MMRIMPHRGPVVAAVVAVYSLPVSQPDAAQIFRIVERDGPAGRVILRSVAGGPVRQFVIAGFQGTELPATLSAPVIEPETGDSGAWRLTAGDGAYRFRARAVDEFEVHPQLYESMHREFALKGTDRVAARLLLWLLRLPGGPRLLRFWHSRRA